MKRLFLFSILLLLCAVPAMAGTITSISPSSVKVNSGEHFVAINGSGLGSVIVFDGPAGHFELNASATFTGSVHFWVPLEIVAKSGTYSVYVRGGTGDSNIVYFTVQGFKFFPFVILVPDVIRFQPTGRDGGYAKYEVMTAGGSVNDPAPRVDCFPASGDFFKMGNTSVSCTAYNYAGEKATADFTLAMVDTVAPVIEVPRELIRVSASSREGAIVNYDVKAYDAIWGDAKPECSPLSGANFPIGVTVVQCYATDFDGNVGSAGFPVEVVGNEKWYALKVDVPGTMAVNARSPEGEYVDWKVTVSGTKDTAPEVSCYPKQGSLFPIGTSAVRCDAIDYNGMRGSAEFAVEVRDPNAPKFEKLSISPYNLPADGRVYPIEVFAAAYDDLDPRPFCSVFNVTSNQLIHLGDADSEKSYDWRITGDLTLELRAETSRGDRYYDVWVGCSDYYGNRVVSSTRVVVSATFGQSTEVTGGKRRQRP